MNPAEPIHKFEKGLSLRRGRRGYPEYPPRYKGQGQKGLIIHMYFGKKQNSLESRGPHERVHTTEPKLATR